MNSKFNYRLIDLTHTLHPAIPTWNGHCGFRHEVYIDYSDCKTDPKFRVMKMSMNAGIGTHIDVPSHCFPDRRSVHEFDVNELCMRCCVIDVSTKSHATYIVSPEDITDFEEKYGPIPSGSCVLVRTGWDRFWSEPKRYHNNYVFPSISAEASELLLQRGINGLGIDTLSPDRPDNGYPVHHVFLGAGKLLIENVANLDSMPPIGSYVLVLPIKILDGTEAPVRLVGLVEMR